MSHNPTRCDVPWCENLSQDCHGGEVYLCIAHYNEAARAVAKGEEVTAWLQRVSAMVPPAQPSPFGGDFTVGWLKAVDEVAEWALRKVGEEESPS